jgi:hypothetical protein
MVSGIAGGIKDLDIAQKAFISAQTGGPGGLAGGYQIEMMMREGNMDQVFNMVQQTLKQQFGGSIVTLEEAAQNAGSAAQMVRQVAFLRQGPLGNVVKSDQEAYRLLEAMKTGTGPGALKSPEAAMKGALAEGEGIQKRQSTILTNIANFTERLAQGMVQQNYLTARQIGGGMVGEGQGASQLNRVNQITGMVLRESQGYAAIEGQRRATAEGERAEGRVGPGGTVSAGTRLPSQVIFDEINRAVQAGSRIKEIITGPAEAAAEPVAPTTASPSIMAPGAALTPSDVIERDIRMQKQQTAQAMAAQAESAVPPQNTQQIIAELEGTTPTTPGPGAAAAAPPTDHNITIRLDMRDMPGYIQEVVDIRIENDKIITNGKDQGTP